MREWSNEERDRMGGAEEIRIAGLKADGTLRKPRIIWIVRVADDLYVRSVNGRASDWFRGVLERHEGRVWAGGVEADVAFVEEPGAGLNEQIDRAYATKYRRYAASIVDSINSPQARAATLRLLPRKPGA